MAQLNPNFEIDFSDINSYEQIQLINDTQLAKENLLMHRAYREPSDDEIIRSHFSSFTFVDFCPKLFVAPRPTGEGLGGRRHYELESFSDLFERINGWLKSNKDWRVVSMETLVYDCSSQFNHLKSSIQAAQLPRNARGLRLYLSPSKSRFSGPQKIGCINVVPRRLAGSHSRPHEPPVYESLDQILDRLNELLLTRPIEGRILSVETITLPMVSGYVNTEYNYYLDRWLNLLNQATYLPAAAAAQGPANDPLRNHALIDILRVYYEFGPLVCGLVNLIDFVPRFYSPTVCDSRLAEEEEQQFEAGEPQQMPKMAASETMTRLVRRSLAWFERERKRILAESKQQVNLKACNLQLCHKILPKARLLLVGANGTALDHIDTREMLHRRASQPPPCPVCAHSPDCPHLATLCEPYEVKFVRLAYVVPVYNRYARPLRISSPRSPSPASSSSSSSSSRDSSEEIHQEAAAAAATSEEELAKQAALSIVRGTNERQREHERRHQLAANEGNQNELNQKLIGQLTYRLFAPCQLVNSSSCFAINPINSSSPLSRRGSVNLSGGQVGSANGQAARRPDLSSHEPQQAAPAQVVTSFGAFFPAQAHSTLQQEQSNDAGQQRLPLPSPSSSLSLQQPQSSSKFATNEFELVEAIRRRMEVYVTTNSMKVIAGETIVVNLSSQLSCLSTAIEQTVSRSRLVSTGREPSTWVSVYVLYAAVEEPQLPEQLLARQRERELARAAAAETPVFDDDFEGAGATPKAPEEIRIEQNPLDSSLTLYNSAYDRTVALPAPPDNQPMCGTGGDEQQLELADLLGEPVDERLLGLRRPGDAAGDDFELVLVQDRSKSRRRQKRKSRNRLDEAQCSIM